MKPLLPLAAALVCAALLLTLGILEKRRNEKNLKQFDIRINVNGIRGKSTITRLITAILIEAGYKTVGKTTGTAARMLYWNREQEEEVVRKPRGVSLVEQVHVIDKAARLGANALVCECMAVRPEYQEVFQHQMIKANLTVIVNVLEDHLDVMGPTTEQIAWAFAKTIPYHGKVVLPQCEFTDYFKKVAAERGTEVFLADDSEITEAELNRFSYKLFPHNVSAALAAARALGIDDETAWHGMYKAHADPGVTKVTPIGIDGVTSWFINAFAANEPASTLEIWDEIQKGSLPTEQPVVVMNCRPDRLDRSRQFAQDFIPFLPPCTLVVIGERVQPIDRAWKRGKFPNVTAYYNLENQHVEQIMDVLTPLLDGHVLLGVGNIHGDGEPLIEALIGETLCISQSA